MKRLLSVLAAVLLWVPAAVFAQSGAICIYADSTASDCNPADTTPGLLSLYVIHSLTPAALGSQFAAPASK